MNSLEYCTQCLRTTVHETTEGQQICKQCGRKKGLNRLVKKERRAND